MQTWIGAAAALIVTAFPLTASLAQPAQGQPGGRDRFGIREACRADFETFCAGVERGGGRLRQCLREHQDHLSQPCVSALAAAQAARRDAPAVSPAAPEPHVGTVTPNP